MSDGIGLDAEGLCSTFPFHFVVDGEGLVIQVGPSLARIAPKLMGSKITEHVEQHRPRGPFDLQTAFTRAPSYVVLRLKASQLLWRGQSLRSGPNLMMLGTPWFIDPAELGPAGLSLDDFAPHDSLIDYLTLLQTKNTALRDANNLSRHLRQTRQKLQRQLDETRAERRRLEALVETVPWGVLVEDEDGQIALTNARFCELFALEDSPEELLGTSCDATAIKAIRLIEDPDAFVRGVQKALADGQQSLGVPVRTTDGRILERDYVPIVDRDGFRGHLWQYRDVTERHQAAEMLEDARSKAEAANTAKSEFLAMMSHEMRTPLGVIVGIAELLRGDTTTDIRREFVERLESNSKALLQLIDSTLDFSRLENRQVQIESAELSPDALLESVVDSLTPGASTRGVRLLYGIAPDVPARMLGDELRMRQVLTNLVGNALKFTNGDEVLVQARLLHAEDARQGVLWSVSDHGPGIPRDRQARIFERFVRAESPNSSRSGTGLGLAICRELCEAMDGTIEIDSDEGRGSTFLVWLPLDLPPGDNEPERMLTGTHASVHSASEWIRTALTTQLLRLGAEVSESVSHPDEQPVVTLRDAAGHEHNVVLAEPSADHAPEGTLAPPITTSRLRGAIGMAAPQSAEREQHPDNQQQELPARILVVDDDPDSVDICRLLLERVGVSVVTADGVASALEKLHSEPFDLVISDLRMPEGGGIRLIEELTTQRHERAWPRPGVVILTAEVLQEQREKAQAAGADSYLTKPIDPESLQDTIERHLDTRPLVLMVEDDASMRMLMAVPMQRLTEHRFVSCPDADSARRIAQHYPIDLVLLDLELGERSGLELLPELQRLGVRDVVAMTGHTESSVHRDCVERGCNDVWTKPIRPNELYDRVRGRLPTAADET